MTRAISFDLDAEPKPALKFGDLSKASKARRLADAVLETRQRCADGLVTSSVAARHIDALFGNADQHGVLDAMVRILAREGKANTVARIMRKATKELGE